MTFLAAQPIEQRQAEQVQALTPSDPDGLKPGFFSGSLPAIGTGLGRVGAVASELVNDTGYLAGSTFITKPIDALFDTDLTGFIDEKMPQEPAQLTASMTPDPYTTGSLGQILYGFIGVGVPAAVGTYFGGPLGGAAMAGSFQAQGTYADLTQQGVDPNTASAAALFDGTLAGVGVGVPASIGRRALLNTLLYGPGVNVSQDLLAGQGMSAILENGGYSEMANRYAEIDGEMLVADAILGAAFGWYGARTGQAGRVARAAPTQTEVDAGLSAMNRRNAEMDTAPGTPADLLAVQSHVRNLESATAAILDGRRVEVEPARGEFLARPEQVIPAPDEFVRAIRESGLPGLMDDIDALEAEMTKRGRVLPDEELPDVRRVANKTPATQVQQVYHGSRRTDIKRISLDRSGTGSGDANYGFGAYFAGTREGADEIRASTSAISRRPGGKLADQALTAAKGDRAEAARALRSRRARSEGAKLAEIDQALEVLRDAPNRGTTYQTEIPPDAMLLSWDEPISAQPESVRAALASMGFADESMAGSAVYRALAATEGGQRQASDALSAAGIPGHRYKDGRGGYHYVVWDEGNIGDLADADAVPTQAKRAGDRQAMRPKGDAAGTGMAERAATEAIADAPDLKLPGGTRAADALEQADAAIARAENDATGFEAAVACFMRNGA